MITPLEQFDIFSLFGKIVLNTSLQLCIVGFIIMVVCIHILTKQSIVYNRFTYIQSKLISFVAEIFNQNISSKTLDRYFLYFLVMFVTIVFLNVLGMIPYSFTVTSHLSVTLLLSLMGFVTFNLLGIYHNGVYMLNLFLPSGVPLLISPFLILIEFISYIARVISLSVRLFANMMAGHTLLKILGGFAFSLLCALGLFSILSVFVLTVILIIIGLELVIAFLQAYVFITLNIIYFNDAINLSH